MILVVHPALSIPGSPISVDLRALVANAAGQRIFCRSLQPGSPQLLTCLLSSLGANHRLAHQVFGSNGVQAR